MNKISDSELSFNNANEGYYKIIYSSITTV